MNLDESRPNIQYPVVHLNGTSVGSLLTGYLDASDAILRVLTLMEAACPNMRDYYPLPDAADAYTLAVREHEARVTVLRKVRAELRALADHVESEYDAHH